jgi:hypothetical protein
MSTDTVTDLAERHAPLSEVARSAAAERDVAGRTRDAAARDRDRAAEVRDLEAQANDALSDRLLELADRIRPRNARELAARAALDRRRAIEDRAMAAAQRADAARDREQAAHDRESSARDRAAARHEQEHPAVGGILDGPLGLALLQREVDRAQRTGTALSVAVLGSGDPAFAAEAPDVAAALLSRVRSYDLVMTGSERGTIVCALTGAALPPTRARVDAVRRALALEGIAVRAACAGLEAEDRAATLVGRAHAALGEPI